jgi:preprotein translocase subunit SecG
MQILITLLYILFVLSAIVLVVVVLLQEGKGGGLTDALGASGQQTFGVGASGITKFTGVTAGVFLASALAIHLLNRLESGSSVVGEFPQVSAPPDVGAGAGGAAGGAAGGGTGGGAGAPQAPATPPAAPAGEKPQ